MMTSGDEQQRSVLGRAAVYGREQASPKAGPDVHNVVLLCFLAGAAQLVASCGQPNCGPGEFVVANDCRSFDKEVDASSEPQTDRAWDAASGRFDSATPPMLSCGVGSDACRPHAADCGATSCDGRADTMRLKACTDEGATRCVAGDSIAQERCEGGSWVAATPCEAPTECVSGQAGQVRCASPCETARCGENSTCNVVENAPRCQCKPDYVESSGTCTFDANCAALKCDPNAECALEGATRECRCRKGFDGDGKTCTNVDECKSSTPPCGPNATCIDTDGSYTCVCKPGFVMSGAECSNIDDCRDGPCQHGGKCSDALNDYTCNCAGTGYTGDRCEVNLDECQSNPCQNRGSCVDLTNDFMCRCPAEWKGKRCEVAACGDGQVDPAAGEECDPRASGVANDKFHCNELCRSQSYYTFCKSDSDCRGDTSICSFTKVCVTSCQTSPECVGPSGARLTCIAGDDRNECRIACTSIRDCPGGSFCNPAEGVCVGLMVFVDCAADPLACPSGSYCDSSGFSCVANGQRLE